MNPAQIVLKMHRPVEVYLSDETTVTVCAECHALVIDVYEEAFDNDDYSLVVYPCPTAKRVISALSEHHP